MGIVDSESAACRLVAAYAFGRTAYSHLDALDGEHGVFERDAAALSAGDGHIAASCDGGGPF